MAKSEPGPRGEGNRVHGGQRAVQSGSGLRLGGRGRFRRSVRGRIDRGFGSVHRSAGRRTRGAARGRAGARGRSGAAGDAARRAALLLAATALRFRRIRQAQQRPTQHRGHQRQLQDSRSQHLYISGGFDRSGTSRPRNGRTISRDDAAGCIRRAASRSVRRNIWKAGQSRLFFPVWRRRSGTFSADSPRSAATRCLSGEQPFDGRRADGATV